MELFPYIEAMKVGGEEYFEEMWMEHYHHRKNWSKNYPTSESVSKYYIYNQHTGELKIKEEFIDKLMVGRLGETEHIDSDGYMSITDVAASLEDQYISAQSVRSHKLIYILMAGKRPKGKVIDHANRIRSDNAWSNLRIATRAENRYNTKIPKNNKSGVKGLKLLEKSNRWKATVSKDGEIRTKTCKFEDKDILVKWLEDTRVELHGEFAAHS